MMTKVKFYFTTENSQSAIDEIELAIENAGFSYAGDIEIVSEERACRNAYGKKLSAEEFDAIDPESDESWFDDYDFQLQANIETPDGMNAEECLSEIDYFGEIVQANLEEASRDFIV